MKYSLSRYGLPDVYDIRRSFSAKNELKLVSMYGGKDISVSYLASESLALSAEGGAGIHADFIADTSVILAANAIMTITGAFIANNALLMDAETVKDLSVSFTVSTRIESFINLVKDISTKYLSGDSITSKCNAVKDMSRSLLYTSELFTSSEAAFVDFDSIFINVSIPSGGVLRIDTENYTVTLDNKNIIHLQEGDWIKLMRGLQQITVSSGTGGALTGSVTYSEGYL